MCTSALIEIDQQDNVCILRCKGRLIAGPDLNYVRNKTDEINALNCRKVVADFRDVRSLGSLGINFIVSVYSSVTKNGEGRFVLAGVIAPVLRVLEITHLSAVIPLAEDLASGLAAIEDRAGTRSR